VGLVVAKKNALRNLRPMAKPSGGLISLKDAIKDGIRLRIERFGNPVRVCYPNK